MDNLMTLVAAVAVVSLVIFIIALVAKVGLVQIEAAKAAIAQNIWTGSTRPLGAGMHLVMPGLEKVIIGDLSLRNEPGAVDGFQAMTADGNQLTVLVVFTTFRVVDAVKASIRIAYSDRVAAVTARLKALAQQEISQHSLAELVAGGAEGKRTVNRQFITGLEAVINSGLNPLKDEWGIEVIVKVDDLQLPREIIDIEQEIATASREGDAIRKKAEKAGVPTWLVAAGDILSDLMIERRQGK